MVLDDGVLVRLRDGLGSEVVLDDVVVERVRVWRRGVSSDVVCLARLGVWVFDELVMLLGRVEDVELRLALRGLLDGVVVDELRFLLSGFDDGGSMGEFVLRKQIGRVVDMQRGSLLELVRVYFRISGEDA